MTDPASTGHAAPAPCTPEATAASPPPDAPAATSSVLAAAAARRWKLLMCRMGAAGWAAPLEEERGLPKGPVSPAQCICTTEQDHQRPSHQQQSAPLPPELGVDRQAAQGGSLLLCSLKQQLVNMLTPVGQQHSSSSAQVFLAGLRSAMQQCCRIGYQPWMHSGWIAPADFDHVRQQGEG